MWQATLAVVFTAVHSHMLTLELRLQVPQDVAHSIQSVGVTQTAGCMFPFLCCLPCQHTCVASVACQARTGTFYIHIIHAPCMHILLLVQGPHGYKLLCWACRRSDSAACRLASPPHRWFGCWSADGAQLSNAWRLLEHTSCSWSGQCAACAASIV